MIRNNIDEIKHILKSHKNKLLMTNRSVGKSWALLELIHEEPESTLITCHSDTKQTFIDRYKSKYEDNGYERIFSQYETKDIQMQNAYIDEYFSHDMQYYTFKGAVSCMRFPIEIKRFPADPIKNYREFLES